MNSEEVKKATTAELKQALANARETYALCGGHHKSDMNQKLIVRYHEELVSRGEDLKDLPEGSFNGKGAY